MVTSYEIEFIGEKEVAGILREALRTDSRVESFEEFERGFKLRLVGAKRKITIACKESGRSDECLLIVNSRKMPENGGIALNADKIAERCGSKPEIAMLGAIAKLGVVDLKRLMSVIYREMGYGDVLAVKKGSKLRGFSQKAGPPGIEPGSEVPETPRISTTPTGPCQIIPSLFRIIFAHLSFFSLTGLSAKSKSNP